MDERQECSTLEIKDNKTKCSRIPNTLHESWYTLEDIGTGSHMHISLPQNGENVFMDGRESSEHDMSKTGEEFMARVLEHLPSIWHLPLKFPIGHAFSTPYVDVNSDGCSIYLQQRNNLWNC